MLESPGKKIVGRFKVLAEELGLPLCATLNNTTLPPTPALLDQLIDNLRPFYEDMGVRRAVIPFITWVRSGKLQRAFDGLLIKNTVLNGVRTAQEYWHCATSGYDHVILHTDLLRNRRELDRVKKAQARVREKTRAGRVAIAILGNEGCEGGCPYRQDHYAFGLGSRERSGRDRDDFWSDLRKDVTV